MPQTILVTGATGYIASRLIPCLLKAGYKVRCLARNPSRLKARAWYPQVQVVYGDVTLPDTLHEAMQGVSAAYYLIHSMSAGHGYDRVDLQSAHNFSLAARSAGVEHIVYLGGLANPDERNLSLHMKSRIETGAALREAGVPVTELRAGVIVGPGSVSFEMIRFIAEQFPLMIGPIWLRHQSQPIATPNVLEFLIAVLTNPQARGKVIELGGLKTFTYIEVMTRYASIRGLKRIPLLLPLVPVRLMAFFIDLLTPVASSYAFPLVEGLQNDSLVLDRAPLSFFPDIHILDYTSAVQRALEDTHPAEMERVWLDLDQDFVAIKHEGMFIDYRRIRVSVSGRAGLDRLVQFVQQSSGFRVGMLNIFKIDFLNDEILRLKVNQKLPGIAWLEWKVTKHADSAFLEQTIFFAPKGLPGFLGWYLQNPLYRSIFNQLLHRAAALL